MVMSRTIVRPLSAVGMHCVSMPAGMKYLHAFVVYVYAPNSK